MGRYAVQSLSVPQNKKIYVADINADAAKDFSLTFSDKSRRYRIRCNKK